MGSSRVWLVLWIIGCGDNKVGTNPPGPAVDPTIPAEVEAALPHDEHGRPILISTPSMISPDERIGLVYDKTLDDPITRWGWCLERVSACYRANPGAPVSKCIDMIEPCADDTGGKACCTHGCVMEFHKRRGMGLDEKAAIAASFVRGDCLPGFAALRGGQ